jgi:hypothetical protein
LEELEKVGFLEDFEKYTKLIICDILLDSQHSASIKINQNDNYIKRIHWQLCLLYQQYKVNLEESFDNFISRVVEIYNFNYDLTFGYYLFGYGLKLGDNVKQIYGYVDISPDQQAIFKTLHRHGLFYSFVNSKDNQINIDLVTHASGKYEAIRVTDIIEKCDKSINWIRGEQTSHQNYSLFQSATHIYFLGFGFDLNNLELIKFDQIFDRDKDKPLKIFISRSDEKILLNIENILSKNEIKNTIRHDISERLKILSFDNKHSAKITIYFSFANIDESLSSIFPDIF